VFLVLLTFISGFLSTSLGAGGGLLLVGIASVMPAQHVVPIHACIMLVVSFFQWWLLRKKVDYEIFKPFIVGGCFGMMLAVPLIGLIEEHTLKFLLGTFLLLTTWFRLPRAFAQNKNYPWQCGIVSSYLGVFVGATRPMLMTLFGSRFNSHQVIVATTTACASVQHAGKLVVFASAGIAFTNFWLEIVTLIAVSAVGAWLGRNLLFSSNGDHLKIAVKLLISVLAVNLIGDAVDWSLPL